MALVNVTIADNTAGGGSGGFISGGSGQATAGNAGLGFGGGVAQQQGTLSFINTIIAANTADQSPDAFGTLASLGYNLIEVTTGASITGTLTGNITGVDPGLQPLADNGGLTQTMAIDATSAAVNAGDDSAAPTDDQRGIPRLGTSDIGAYEFNPFVVTNTNASGPGSLYQAIIANNASSGGNTITFQIGAAGNSQTIEPLADGNDDSLPTILEPLTIDGWSQGGPGYSGQPLIDLDGTLGESEGGSEAGSFGFDIESDNVVIRGFDIDNFGNGIGGGFGIGVFAVGSNANIWIYGNDIGTDSTGLVAAGNGQGGIRIGTGVGGVLIGSNTSTGNPADQANVIAGNGGIGILVQGNGNTIYGNFIGVGADGATPLGNAGPGIYVEGSNNVLGGIAAGQANIIAFNTGDGVESPSGSGNTIRGNSIFGNGGLGIDLGSHGNLGLQAPVFTGNVYVSPSLSMTFETPAAIDAAYPLTTDFYLADSSGSQGETYLGSVVYTAADADTLQAVTFTPAIALTYTDQIVATTTDAKGNTSEFSAPVTVNAPPVLTLPGPAVDCTQYQSPVVLDATATVTDADGRPLDGGTLTVDIPQGAAIGDQLSIAAVGGISADASAGVVYCGEEAIGTFSGGTDGSTPLVIALNSNASADIVQSLRAASHSPRLRFPPRSAPCSSC